MGKTIGILGCVCLLLCGSVLYGQSRSSAINGAYNNQPLEKVLQDLKHTYKLFFVHDNSLLEGIFVTASFENQSLDQAMRRILYRTPLAFEIIEKGRVLLFRKEPARLRLAKSRQDVVIEGYIHDVTNHAPLAYSVVMLQGTRIGVNTDERGFFSLQIPYSDSIKLEVSYLGYIPVILNMATGDLKKNLKNRAPAVGPSVG